MTNSAPVVAVTGPVSRFPLGWWATRFMLRRVGVRAVHLTAATDTPPAGLQGVVIGGGDDIEPWHYGESAHPEKYYDRQRDRLEMAVIRQALAEKVPLLGICRGAQLLNVVLQGSLYQDIRPLRQRTANRANVMPVKWVALNTGSWLAETTGGDSIKVNSLHNQAINRVGEGLQVVGRDNDGFVQAVEWQAGFAVGVQWHPEYLPYKKRHRKIFAAFAAQVKQSSRRLTLEL